MTVPCDNPIHDVAATTPVVPRPPQLPTPPVICTPPTIETPPVLPRAVAVVVGKPWLQKWTLPVRYPLSGSNHVSWMSSAVFHAVVILLLALWTSDEFVGNASSSRWLLPAQSPPRLETIQPADLPIEGPPIVELSHAASAPLAQPVLPPLELPTENADRPASSSALDSFAAENWQNLLQHAVGFVQTSDDFRDRADSQHRQRALETGGNKQSEQAVERALAWLAAHQRDDGSWRFDHTNAICQGECRNPGSFHSANAATGLALLPFLGAGYTHQSGPYQAVVQNGLYYLGSKMIVTKRGGDLHQQTMYAQGIATLALCECYGMTRDKSLKPYAKAGIDFILNAQDPRGGGWRYAPLQPGDTTVTGWQVLALRSGELAGLMVPSPTLGGVEKFLDHVQADDGAAYGYQSPEPTRTNTSIGLLCRMLLGWPRGERALVRGVSWLEKQGPHPNDMYFNYYATQVMHHFGGSPWDHWNRQMRDFLIKTQAQQGHESGSWYFPGDEHGKVGGRLYATCLAAMTLEVYYRYLPIYESGAK